VFYLDVAYVAMALHVCFKCFRRMFQVFYLDVAYVTMTTRIFQAYVLSVSDVLDASISSECCICCYGYTRMFQVFHLFHTYVASVSSIYFKSRSREAHVTIAWCCCVGHRMFQK
jgi:hypothetical protein